MDPYFEYDNSRTDDDLSVRWARQITADHLTLNAPAMEAFMVRGDERVWINAYQSENNALRMVVVTYPVTDGCAWRGVHVFPVGPDLQIGTAFSDAFLAMEHNGWKSVSPRSVGR